MGISGFLKEQMQENKCSIWKSTDLFTVEAKNMWMN